MKVADLASRISARSSVVADSSRELGEDTIRNPDDLWNRDPGDLLQLPDQVYYAGRYMSLAGEDHFHDAFREVFVNLAEHFVAQALALLGVALEVIRRDPVGGLSLTTRGGSRSGSRSGLVAATVSDCIS